MPELPEVEVTRQGVEQHCQGLTLEALHVYQAALRWPIPNSIGQCVGQPLKAVQRRAKYLLMHFGNHVLVVHLGMSGALKVVPTGTPLHKHDHVEWVFGTQTLRYNDPRRFGSIDHISAEHTLAHPNWQADYPRFEGLGPEPFGPDFSPASLYLATRGRNLPIKALLLAGTAVVGAGNIYACEALFRAGLAPSQAAGRLSRKNCIALHQEVVAVLGEAIARGGTTLRNYSAPSGDFGQFQLECLVYGREGLPCVRCRGSIKRRVMNQRSTFYCPRCQLAK